MHSIALGIDVSKTGLDVCRAVGGQQPRDWPVTHITYEADDWHNQLARLAGWSAVVAIEPTGWAYLQPPLAVLERRAAMTWLIPNPITGKVRQVHIARGKSDNMDARALALVASWIARGEDPPRGAYPYDSETDEAVTRLRSLINALETVTKDMARTKNRLDALAHAVWPALTRFKSTYARAVDAGAILPAELHMLAANPKLELVPGYAHGSARVALRRMLEHVPADVPVVPYARDRIVEERAQLRALQLRADNIRAYIHEAVQEFDELYPRLMTIPYASTLAVAAVLVATHGRTDGYDINALKTALGVAPHRNRSGATDRRQSTRPGYRPAVKQVHIWTMKLLQKSAPPNEVRDFFQRLKARNHPHAMSAARAKLARLISGVSRSPEGYRYAGQNQ